jgi:hypothetical protein
MRTIATIAVAAVVVMTGVARGQTDPTRESMPAALPSTTLGLRVSPAKNQTMDQQRADETECYGVSKQQTGVDPFAAPTPSASQRAAFDKGFTGCLVPRGYTIK